MDEGLTRDDPALMAGLRRASAAGIPHVSVLQRAAYAANRPILGVEPLPLGADYSEQLNDRRLVHMVKHIC